MVGQAGGLRRVRRQLVVASVVGLWFGGAPDVLAQTEEPKEERQAQEDPDPKPPAAPDDDAAEPPAVEPPAPPSGASAPGAAGTDPAWDLYHRAFSLAAIGNSGEARAVLKQLAKDHPGHPAVARSGDVLRALDRAAVASPGDSSQQDDDWIDPAAPEKPEKTARAELALAQTIHGLATGIEICLLIECDDAVAGTFLAVGGAGAGVGISLLATKGGITPGRRGLLNSGTFWGAYNGVLLLFIADVDGGQEAAGLLLFSQYSGLGLGAALWSFEPTDGQVALANTVGVWSSVLALETFGLLADNVDGEELPTTMLLAADAGLIAGAVLARRVRMSRGRTLVIDSGGILGALLGVGSAILIEGDSVSQEFGFGSALGGTIAGLGVATYLTRHWDAPQLPARLTPIAVQGGGFGAGVVFDLDL